MYHAHFALQHEPFGASPDQRCFLGTEQHREALATLYYAVSQRRGFALLVGHAGLGKTSVLLQLLQMLEGRAETAYLPHPYFDRGTVLESIFLSLGLEFGASMPQNYRSFYEYLLKTRGAGKTCVIILDEAQDLSGDTLEAIRMLSNFESPSEKLVQIVLSGQPRLAETLRQPGGEQLRQRFSSVARLKPLGDLEVRDYIGHRLQGAGASLGLFAPEALRAITLASGGVPRNINTICFNSLTLAYALSHAQVGSEEVSEVLRDLDLDLCLGAPDPTGPVLGNPDVRPQGRAEEVQGVQSRDSAPLCQSVPAAPGIPESGEGTVNRVDIPARSAASPQSVRAAVIAASVVAIAAGTFLLHSVMGAS